MDTHFNLNRLFHSATLFAMCFLTQVFSLRSDSASLRAIESCDCHFTAL
jgi:hypothetical protein